MIQVKPAAQSPGRYDGTPSRFHCPKTMSYALLKLVHLLAVILWVGGMLFAHCFLRPAAAGWNRRSA